VIKRLSVPGLMLEAQQENVMLKKSTMLAAATLGLVGFGASVVQAAPPVDKKWELTLAGAGTNDNDFETGTFSLTGSVGYYFSDQLQVNFRQGLIYSDNDSSDFSGVSKVGLDYLFDYGQDQRFIPYIGISAGYAWGDLYDDSWVVGPEAGIKYYVNDTTFVFGQVSYDFSTDESFGDGSFNYGLGIGFRF
jgi:hypothetical protein